jgi:hypothetical protein
MSVIVKKAQKQNRVELLPNLSEEEIASIPCLTEVRVSSIVQRMLRSCVNTHFIAKQAGSRDERGSNV